ncbi:tyrosine-type recombinase/integrase [Bacillus sp. AFS001701]|uniref:tyrosine-type recombinase/integrase n=1 Tax=Bacillus sp. AFS001701 TaxID=2033480 RepID=UPI0015964B57|nr:tyrosine-type recombinase/integrase [Bacillus sp. AFS001701]
MSKKLDPKRLEASIKKIDKVFDKMSRKGISVGGGRVSDRTIKTYKDMVTSLVRECHTRFKVSDISNISNAQVNVIIQDKIDLFHGADTSQAYNLKTLVAALKFFNLGVQETNVFSYDNKFSIGEPDKIREVMKKQYVIRKSKASKVLRATPEECQSVLDNIKKSGYSTDTREVAYNVSNVAFKTGGRVSAILRLRPRDINFKENTITFKKDKGGLTRTVRLSDETMKYLASLVKGKKDHQPIFTLKREEDGTFKSVEEIRKEISKVVAEAGAHLTRTEMVKMKDKDGKHILVPVEKKASLHIFRKGFAVERTGEYYNQFPTKSSIDSYVSKRGEENPKIIEKLKIVRERINKDRTTKRDLTREEYAIFFTSVDLGHFRNDVITSFYTTFKEVQEYYNKK